jgi:hypothetical protein
MDESLQLAKLWATLERIKGEIDNVAVPLGSHLGLEDPKLMITLEELLRHITAHFERFRLMAVVRRTERGMNLIPVLFATRCVVSSPRRAAGRHRCETHVDARVKFSQGRRLHPLLPSVIVAHVRGVEKHLPRAVFPQRY